MTFLEITSFLDTHWLSTILDSVFAIFIFLLGIPLLFAHVFMPEELRELYNRRFRNTHLRKIKGFIIWTVLFALIFSNHLIKNLIEICETCIVPIWLIIFNIITLSAFLLFFFSVLKYLKDVFLNKASYIELLLESIKTEIGKNKSITPEIISDLQIICGGTRDPNSRQKFLNNTNEIISNYLSYKNMDDSILEELVNDVLIDAVLENHNFHNERDMKIIHSIADNIIAKSILLQNRLTCRAPIYCLTEIGKLCIKNEKSELLGKCLDTMFVAEDSYEQIKELCYLSFQNGKTLSTSYYAFKYLRKHHESTTQFDKEAALKYSITLFSWLNYKSDSFQKKYVLDELGSKVASGVVKKAEMVSIMASYVETNDFFTASAIDELVKTCYSS